MTAPRAGNPQQQQQQQQKQKTPDEIKKEQAENIERSYSQIRTNASGLLRFKAERADDYDPTQAFDHYISSYNEEKGDKEPIKNPMTRAREGFEAKVASGVRDLKLDSKTYPEINVIENLGSNLKAITNDHFSTLFKEPHKFDQESWDSEIRKIKETLDQKYINITKKLNQELTDLPKKKPAPADPMAEQQKLQAQLKKIEELKKSQLEELEKLRTEILMNELEAIRRYFAGQRDFAAAKFYSLQSKRAWNEVGETKEVKADAIKVTTNGLEKLKDATYQSRDVPGINFVVKDGSISPQTHKGYLTNDEFIKAYEEIFKELKEGKGKTFLKLNYGDGAVLSVERLKALVLIAENQQVRFKLDENGKQQLTELTTSQNKSEAAEAKRLLIKINQWEKEPRPTDELRRESDLWSNQMISQLNKFSEDEKELVGNLVLYKDETNREENARKKFIEDGGPQVDELTKKLAKLEADAKDPDPAKHPKPVDLNAAKDAKEKAVKAKDKYLGAGRDAYEAAGKKFDKEYGSLNKEVKTSQTKFDGIQTRIDNLNKEIKELKTKETEIKDLETKEKAKPPTITQAEKQRLQQLTADVARLPQLIAEVGDDKAGLTKDLKEAETKLDAAKKKLDEGIKSLQEAKDTYLKKELDEYRQANKIYNEAKAQVIASGGAKSIDADVKKKLDDTRTALIKKTGEKGTYELALKEGIRETKLKDLKDDPLLQKIQDQLMGDAKHRSSDPRAPYAAKSDLGRLDQLINSKKQIDARLFTIEERLQDPNISASELGFLQGQATVLHSLAARYQAELLDVKMKLEVFHEELSDQTNFTNPITAAISTNRDELTKQINDARNRIDVLERHPNALTVVENVQSLVNEINQELTNKQKNVASSAKSNP